MIGRGLVIDFHAPQNDGFHDKMMDFVAGRDGEGGLRRQAERFDGALCQFSMEES